MRVLNIFNFVGLPAPISILKTHSFHNASKRGRTGRDAHPLGLYSIPWEELSHVWFRSCPYGPCGTPSHLFVRRKYQAKIGFSTKVHAVYFPFTLTPLVYFDPYHSTVITLLYIYVKGKETVAAFMITFILPCYISFLSMERRACLENMFKKNHRVALSPFLRLLNPFITILRCLALFPANKSTRHVSNAFFYIVVATLTILDVYFMTYKLISILSLLFTNINATSLTLLAFYLWFHMALSFVVFTARIGYDRILEQFSELLLLATEQEALENKYFIVRKKLLFIAAFIGLLVLSITALIPTFCFTEIGNTWPAAKSLQTLLFFNNWYVNIFVSVVIFYNALAKGAWIFLYVALSESLKEEFNFVNEQIRNMYIRDIKPFKKVALKHSQLLKCLEFLHGYLSIYMFICFSIVTVISVIFAYLLMTDAPISFRLFSGFFLMANIFHYLTFCISGESLSKSVSEFRIAMRTVPRSKTEIWLGWVGRCVYAGTHFWVADSEPEYILLYYAGESLPAGEWSRSSYEWLGSLFMRTPRTKIRK